MFITPKIHKHNTFSAQDNNEVYHNKEAYFESGSIQGLRASATVETAVVIPLFIYAVMALMYFIQVMAVRAHVNQALYITLKKSAGYAYIYMKTLTGMPDRKPWKMDLLTFLLLTV